MLEKILSTQFISVTVTLILLMDGLGNIPSFLCVLKQVTPKRQLVIITRELVIALIIMFIFAFCGDYLLNYMGINNSSLLIAGGIILFIIALRMIFSIGSGEDFGSTGDPFIFPLAVPLIAGPSVLAAIMVFSKDLSINGFLFLSISLAWLITTIILLFSTPISMLLGPKGLLATEKLMGLILLILGVQLFLDGFYSFFMK